MTVQTRMHAPPRNALEERAPTYRLPPAPPRRLHSPLVAPTLAPSSLHLSRRLRTSPRGSTQLIPSPIAQAFASMHSVHASPSGLIPASAQSPRAHRTARNGGGGGGTEGVTQSLGRFTNPPTQVAPTTSRSIIPYLASPSAPPRPRKSSGRPSSPRQHRVLANTSGWVDDKACAAVCLLILNDGRGGSCSCCNVSCSGGSSSSSEDVSISGAQRLHRPTLPPSLYSEHIASFLRFGSPLPNMLYAIGGRNSQRGPVDVVEMLDTWHGVWVECPAMPRRRAGAAVATLPDGRVLVVGGYDERGISEGILAECDLYDPYQERWTPGGVAHLQRARWGHGCAALGGRVYAVGGCSLLPDAEPHDIFMETLRTCEAYDPDRDCWEPFPSLQVPRSGLRVITVSCQYLVAVGGCDDVFGRADTQATVEIYDIFGCGGWELLKSRLAQPRTSAAVAAIDDERLLLAGGASSQLSVEEPLAPVEVYSLCRGRKERTIAELRGDVHPPVLPPASSSQPQEDPLLSRADDMLGGRMGCQAATLRFPSKDSAFPICDTECILIVGGEQCNDVDGDQFLPQQLCTVLAYDIANSSWREASAVPAMTVPRTTVAICVGVGRVATARLPVVRSLR
eukprot:TRINITY_DN40688_c0_g1_i1.p1 TRINITY_DN40688_c0_g1~~TRINITY_DN40688_c0_g1_i1.p1  ORF type:complete len:648 (-),score=78.43 TRINITY_DN40688_c0_g1_i1:58-1926(-)